MQYTNRRMRCWSFGAALALLLVSTAAAQEGEPELSIDDSAVEEGVTIVPDSACFETCSGRSGAADCRFDAQEAKRLCLERNGCDALRGTYVDACLGENIDTSVCNQARERLRSCVAPCHRDLQAQLGSCRELMSTCLEQECGIELPEAPAGHVFRRRLEP
jgi:hypothetical protein